MRHAGYRVKVRYPYNATAFYVQATTGYFTPDSVLSNTLANARITTEGNLAAIWQRKSKAMTVAACLQAEIERDGKDAHISFTPVSLRDGSLCWERVIR